MKKTSALAVLCVLAACTPALAQESPRLVGEKKVLKLDDTVASSENAGAWTMRLSPDGRHMLYLRKKTYKAAQPDGPARERRGYKPILRDLTTGKDTPLPVPALFDDDFAAVCLSMELFDPSGKTIVLPAGQDTNGDGYTDTRGDAGEKCKVGLYTIATGKLKTLEIEADLTFPTFHPDGKTLVVMTLEMKTGKAQVHVTPLAAIKFRQLSKAGLIRSISPASGLMGMMLLTEEQGRPRPGDFVLFDLKADKVHATLADGSQVMKLDDYKPQWTGDGRYLYSLLTKREEREERTHTEYLTQIWDAQAGKEAGILSGVAAIGPGPGKGTMVMTKLASMLQGQSPEMVLHAQGDKALGNDLHRLGDENTRAISTRGKWLLYIRKFPGGDEWACKAEIALPEK